MQDAKSPTKKVTLRSLRVLGGFRGHRDVVLKLLVEPGFRCPLVVGEHAAVDDAAYDRFRSMLAHVLRDLTGERRPIADF